MFTTTGLKKSLRQDRDLPGIDWNVAGQLDLLDCFHYNDEILRIAAQKKTDVDFSFDIAHNITFRSGDAEFLYNLIRHFKPRRIVEVGSGNSTLMAATAVRANREEDPNYRCDHTCIEPFLAPYLEKVGVKVIRKLVEDVDRQPFLELERNDILFIDSSHMIRPQGDVLLEYLEILPSLKSGVLVHVHDIFTPKDYMDEWLIDNVCFWNEQYLLEAFLTFNSEFRIIGAVNYLRHHYPERLTAKCPVLKKEIETREPGSFWIQKK